MKKFILLTRPRLASERMAHLLAQRGVDSLIEPLLIIEPTYSSRPEGLFQGVLITSANALENLPNNLEYLFSLPCFCVGAATGHAARAVGFTNIHCGTSDSAELARKATALLQTPTASLLHIAGESFDGKAHDFLTDSGFTVTLWTVYRAHAVEDFTPETRAAFTNNELAAIPVFSPRSARILVSLIEKNGLSACCSQISALGLSQAVANVLQTLPWRRVGVAATPSEEAVLSLLQSEIS